MTERQLRVCRAILESLNALEGGQMAETLLHADVNLRLTPTISRAEFEDGLGICDTNGWVTGVMARHRNTRLWNIADAGVAARLEMR